MSFLFHMCVSSNLTHELILHFCRWRTEWRLQPSTPSCLTAPHRTSHSPLLNIFITCVIFMTHIKHIYDMCVGMHMALWPYGGHKPTLGRLLTPSTFNWILGSHPDPQACTVWQKEPLPTGSFSFNVSASLA